MNNCKSCNNTINEKYCAHCGTPARLKRIDSHYISHEVQHLLHFEKGVFYTVKELLVRPGESIRAFIAENRDKHMKPVAFLILTSVLYTLIAHALHIEPKDQLSFGKSSIGNIMHWIDTHYGYANIMMGIFIALWMKLFFRKSGYNLFEIIVLLCFVMGEGMLLLSLAILLAKLSGSALVFQLISLVIFIYPTFAIGQFYGKTKAASYVKAFLAYLLGTLSFYAVVIMIGLLYDITVKSMTA